MWPHFSETDNNFDSSCAPPNVKFCNREYSSRIIWTVINFNFRQWESTCFWLRLWTSVCSNSSSIGRYRRWYADHRKSVTVLYITLGVSERLLTRVMKKMIREHPREATISYQKGSVSCFSAPAIVYFSLRFSILTFDPVTEIWSLRNITAAFIAARKFDRSPLIKQHS